MAAGGVETGVRIESDNLTCNQIGMDKTPVNR